MHHRRYSDERRRKVKLLRYLVVVVLVTGLAKADRSEAACDQSGGEPVCAGTFYLDANSLWNVKPESGKLAANLPAIAPWEYLAAISQASGTWTNHTNGRAYRVRSMYTEGLWPRDDTNCTSHHRGSVQVIVLNNTEDQDPEAPSVDLCGPSRACAIGRCKYFDTVRGRTVSRAGAVIIMKRDNGASVDNPWEVGLPVNGFDLVETLTHELGHIANLTHPSSAPATMGGGDIGTTRRRELYQWDMECAQECAQLRAGTDRRSLQVYTRQVSETSPHFSSESAPAVASVSDVTSTFRFSGGNWFVTRTDAPTGLSCSSGTAYSTSMTGSSTCLASPFERADGIGPTGIVFREDPSNQYILHATVADSPSGQTNSSHVVEFRRSTDNFQTGTSGALLMCSGMTGWFQCSSTTEVRTSEETASTWLNGNLSPQHPSGATVVTWVRNKKDNSSTDRHIRVAVGRVNANTLPEPIEIALRTIVSPSVACRLNFNGQSDCLVAYVPPDNTQNNVRVARLSITQATTRYDVFLDGTHQVDLYAGRTADAPALFLVGSTFFLVIRSSTVEQNLVAFRSTNGSTWTKINETIGYSTIAPKVQSNWPDTATKQIVYAR